MRVSKCVCVCVCEREREREREREIEKRAGHGKRESWVGSVMVVTVSDVGEDSGRVRI